MGSQLRIESESQGHEAFGVDELNLAEFPLASISDRIPDGKKTLVYEDLIFDREEGRELKRRLTLSGSDRYGLPTAKDDDVLLACIQISKLQDFQSPEVSFSRYELLKLLRWSDDTRNYERLSQSLRRWKGLTVFSDRAFYDHAEKSWVNRDFSIFDTLYIYRREVRQGASAPGASRFTWNDVIFKSFKAGYLKRLDWSLYTRLQSPVAKRLYRFLDKRFYRSNSVEIDLKELMVYKIGASGGSTGQMKRTLKSGIEELTREWDLKALADSRLFEKKGKGSWVVRFERKRRALPPTITKVVNLPPQADLGNLEFALTKRGVGPAAAEELVQSAPTETVQTMVELFDWYNRSGKQRHAGFLVQSIRNPNSIVLPQGFTSTVRRAEQKTLEKNRIAQERELISRRELEGSRKEEARQKAFLDFWRKLSPKEQFEFERKAIEKAERTKLQGYSRSQGQGGKLFEHYRMVILRDYFEFNAKGVPQESA
ncbi:MAG: replication initiator protein A [Planctomycetales bacterium]|nr:replication initiator protein A [Planctomycetales bacterium]